MMIIPTQTAYEVRSGYVLPEQTVNPMIPQWHLTWLMFGVFGVGGGVG